MAKGHVLRTEVLAGHTSVRGHVLASQILSNDVIAPTRGHVLRSQITSSVAATPTRGHVIQAEIQSVATIAIPIVLSTDNVTVPSRSQVTLAAVLQSPDVPSNWEWVQSSGPAVTLIPSTQGDTCTVLCPAPIVPVDVIILVRAALPDFNTDWADTVLTIQRHRVWVGRDGVERPVGKRKVIVPPKPPGYVAPIDPDIPPPDPIGLIGDSSVIAAWGDSLTSGTGGGPGGYVSALQANLTDGRTTFNGGRGGETAQEIAIRQGGQSLTLSAVGGTIPISGPIGVTYSENIGWSSNVTWSSVGTLAGIPGTISRAIGSTTLTFTRTTNGTTATPATNLPWASTPGQQNRGFVQILWAGRNDLGDTTTNSLVLRNRVTAATQAMVNYLSDPAKPYLVLSVLNRTVESSASTGSTLIAYNNVINGNADLAAAHGAHYLDVRTYLVQNGLADAGITPTAADSTAMATNTLPPSLTSDGLHLNAAGYAVVEKIVEAKLKQLRYIPNVVTPGVATPGLAWALDSDLNNTTKYPVMMFPHYFTPYPISVDNVAVTTTAPYIATDQYSRVWNDPNANYGDEHTTRDPVTNAVINNHYMKNHGGYFRGRPMPRPPIAANFKIEDCKTDIRQARSSGWNGFMVEILGLSGSNYDNSINLITACTALVPDGSFKLVPQLDANGGTAQSTNYVAIAAYLKRFYDAPSKFVLPDGRFVVATFLHEGQPPSKWDAIAAQMLSSYNITIAWIGVFNSMATASQYPMYGSGFWGKGSNPGTQANLSSTDMNNARARGNKWMPPIWNQDVRPRSQLADEGVGFRALTEGWKKLVSWNPDYVLGATWSDFSEGSSFNVTVHAGWCNLDISTYFITRIKTGVYPTIVRDVVYLAHRNQFWDAVLSQMTAGVQTTRMAWWNRGTNSTAKQNIVETLTFLTAPAEVTVTVGGVETTYTAPAGMFSNLVPLRAGSVSVVMTRGGVQIGAINSPVTVTNTPKNDDLEYYKFSSLRGTAGQFSPTNQAPTYGNTQPLTS